jgi:hypothetical protein
MVRRHKRGHIKPVTHWFAATVNCSFATHPAAVTIKRCDSDQSRNFATIEFS